MKGEYVGFQRRRASVWAAAEGADVVDEPGVVGWASRDPRAPGGRLFVHGQVVQRRLGELLDTFAPHDVTLVDEPVADSHASAARVLVDRPEFAAAPTRLTGMVRYLDGGLPVPPLPLDLELRRVRRVPGDDVDGVPLEQAAAAAVRADPEGVVPFDADRLAAHLRRAADAVLLTALDRDGEVRATSGASFTGQDTTIYFVTTDPAHRGRGVATAMTARALAEAAQRGATLACLDASAAGRGIYARLGFSEAVVLWRWNRLR